MIKHLLYLYFLIAPFCSNAQDIHFSQFTRTQFLINPAFTGTFSGNVRATMNWKDQWRSVNKTFRTYATSAEVSFAKGRARRPTFYALGIHMAKHVSGDIQLGTTTIGASFASLIQLSRNQRLCLGVQGAFGKSGISTANMQWGSQYSGLNFDPTLYDGEGIEYLPQQYSDFSAGIGYWYHKNDRSVIFAAAQDAKIGLAVYHINRPENAFTVSGNSRVPMRVAFHASAVLATPASNLYVYPNFTAQFQGPQHEFFFGALMKYVIKSGSKMTGMTADMSVAGGLNFRVNNVFDAIVPQVFFDFQAFSVGMSYDINVSGLKAASSYRGGFELSLRFTNPDRYTHRNPQRRGVTI